MAARVHHCEVAVRCGAAQRSGVWCGAVQRSAAQRSAVLREYRSGLALTVSAYGMDWLSDWVQSQGRCGSSGVEYPAVA